MRRSDVDKEIIDPALLVEDLTEEKPEPVLDRWQRIGARLAELDASRFQRVLAIAEVYVSVYDRPLESEDAFQARMRMCGRKPVQS